VKRFWGPKPNAKDYGRPLMATARAIRASEPEAIIIAPACSSICLGFIRELARMHALDEMDAVSVHPYRASPPETVSGDYWMLRRLLEACGLHGRPKEW